MLLDVWLQGSKLDGLQLLEQIKRRDPTLPVLMISGHGNLDTAVAAIREGAVDFIEKPFKADRLLHLVGRATETDRLRRENADLRQQVGPGRPARRHVGRDQHRPRDAEAGRPDRQPGADHRAGRRRQGNRGADDPQLEPARQRRPSSSLSAAMMSPERVEEELFGSEQSGVARPGLLEQAHGGTCSSTRSPTCR